MHGPQKYTGRTSLKMANGYYSVPLKRIIYFGQSLRIDKYKCQFLLLEGLVFCCLVRSAFPVRFWVDLGHQHGFRIHDHCLKWVICDNRKCRMI